MWEYVNLTFLFKFFLYSLLGGIVFGMVLIIVIPFILAVIVALRDLTRESSPHLDQKQFRTALYSGKVSHVRFGKPGPTHGFSYPIFWFLVDLKEVDEIFKDYLWPLSNSFFMSFNAADDHLINGEGMKSKEEGPHNGDCPSVNMVEPFDLDTRIRNLVKERTNGKCQAKGDIMLLTNLTYYGYCFNPVSFYYVLKESAPKHLPKNSATWEVEAIVAEVSNTPWLEMHCYVLHPHSSDMKDVKAGKKSSLWHSTNYIFPKVFHVSPFFQMDYLYDWILWRPGNKLAISTSLKQNGKNAFNAFAEVEKVGLNPFILVFYFIRFPAYCLLVQVWIHIQALYLTIKGVEFIPHPEGSETIVSQIISASMAPYFALKDRLSKASHERNSKKTN